MRTAAPLARLLCIGFATLGNLTGAVSSYLVVVIIISIVIVVAIINIGFATLGNLPGGAVSSSLVVVIITIVICITTICFKTLGNVRWHRHLQSSSPLSSSTFNIPCPIICHNLIIVKVIISSFTITILSSLFTTKRTKAMRNSRPLKHIVEYVFHSRVWQRHFYPILTRKTVR